MAKIGLMRKFLLFIPLVFASNIVFGWTNLFGGYPEFDEMKPTAPYEKNEYTFNAYRNEVETYVRNANEYIENANRDAEDLRRKQQEAFDSANRVVEEFNEWARGNY